MNSRIRRRKSWQITLSQDRGHTFFFLALSIGNFRGFAWALVGEKCQKSERVTYNFMSLSGNPFLQRHSTLLKTSVECWFDTRSHFFTKSWRVIYISTCTKFWYFVFCQFEVWNVVQPRINSLLPNSVAVNRWICQSWYLRGITMRTGKRVKTYTFT